MVRSLFSSALLLASSLAPFAYAQTHSDCNPLKAKCPNNPGLSAKSVNLDFTQQQSIPDGWVTENQGQLKFEKDGAKFLVAKPNDSLNLVSKFYTLFGSFEFKVKAAPGKGIISTVVLISDDLDEVDWEILSIEPNDIQSNYFGKGDDQIFDRGGKHPAPNNQNTWHVYRLDWTPEYVSWTIDGKTVRKLNFADAKGGDRFPQTPMRVKIGAWAAGDPTTNRPGTVEWSGGPTDWSAGPFAMAIESIKIINFTPAKEFEYSDNSGSYKSIKVIGGSLMSNAAGNVEPPAPPPSASKPVSTPPPPVSSIAPTASPTAPATVVELSTTFAVTSTTSASRIASSNSTSRATSTTSRAATATANAAASAGSSFASGFALCVGLMAMVLSS